MYQNMVLNPNLNCILKSTEEELLDIFLRKDFAMARVMDLKPC